MSWLKSLAAIFLSEEIGVIPAIVVTEALIDDDDEKPVQVRECHHHHHAMKNDENPDYGDWI